MSSNGTHYALNGDTWEEKTWNGLSRFWGNDIWTDGTNTYYSSANFGHYVLTGDTWETKHGLDCQGLMAKMYGPTEQTSIILQRISDSMC